MKNCAECKNEMEIGHRHDVHISESECMLVCDMCFEHLYGLNHFQY